MSAAIRDPWAEWTPAPLPEHEAQLLAEVLDYAAMIERGEKQLESVSMQKAAALDALYRSETWVAEAMEVQPAKKDAVGRPPVPNSRNRFSKWLNERAKKSGDVTLVSRRINQLLAAHELASYGNARSRNYPWTEYVYRPLLWMTRNGPRHGETFTDRIPDVERIAIDIAGSPDRVTNAIMRQAVAQFKKDIKWTGADNIRSKGERKAKRYAVKALEDFKHAVTEDPTSAYEAWVQMGDMLKAVQVAA